MSALVVLLEIPDAFQRRAEYVFSFFSSAWGLPLRTTRNGDENPHIVYGPISRCNFSDTILHIQFDENAYEASAKCTPFKQNEILLWTPVENKAKHPDLVGMTYRLLNLLDETQIGTGYPNSRSAFSMNTLPRTRKQSAKLPIVENHCDYLLRALLQKQPQLGASIIPRWPNDCSFAIAITHDTDAVSLSAPAELATNLVKFFLRKDTTHLKMFASGLRHIGKVENPFWGFPVWKEYESSHGFKSCFYLASGVQKGRFHVNDCKSTVFNTRVDWRLLRKMADEGWEFGLHAPIYAKDNLDCFIEGKDMIEKKLGQPIFGLRHHYWSLDSHNPFKTFRKHVNAGFLYDTSMTSYGTGFRSGTSLPYSPFDPERDKLLQMYELPTCLMDGFILEGNADSTEAVRQGREIVQTVREAGGVAVLDWHTETACNSYCYKNYFSVLQEILIPFLIETDTWFATPLEIIRHWHERNKRLQINCGVVLS